MHVLGDDYFLPNPVISEHATSFMPTITVCIPTRNRVRTIEACLSSIRAQEYPGLELIVVDNESTDNTAAIAARYVDRLLSSPGPLGRVRQASIDGASGDILAILDDDIVMPHPRWLRHAVRLFMSGDRVATVWPRLTPPDNAGLLTRGFFALNDAIFADRIRARRGVFGGGNSLFRRDAIEAVGGFDVDADFGEDMILAGRLQRAGYRVAYCADPLIHDTMYSLHEIYRKQLWGANAISLSGWKLMRQTMRSLMYEQLVVGTRAFLRGIVVDHDPAWLAYPVLLAAKSLAYGKTIAQNRLART